MNINFLSILGDLLIPAAAMVLFFIVGRLVERRHLAYLKQQEAALAHIRVEQLKTLPPNWITTSEPVLVVGSVVLANDFFKMFISGLKKIVGGRLGEYERLIDRGRREAVIRMKQMAADHGCNVVWNMRLETSMINDSPGRNEGATSAEIFAYGTAINVKPE